MAEVAMFADGSGCNEEVLKSLTAGLNAAMVSILLDASLSPFIACL